MGRTKQKEYIAGRLYEQRVLTQVLNSKKAEFVALYGRRRIGKTYLVRAFFSNQPCIFFHMTGIQEGTLEEHLAKFSEQVGKVFYGGAQLADQPTWLKAFEILNKALERLGSTTKIVLFFDELPWMATNKSRILQALEYYWNRHWGLDSRIRLIVCGSSASWIIKRIIKNKKGLYNRVTEKMRLSPFTLAETKEYLDYLGIPLNQAQILELYMALGGIPHYLEKVGKLRRGLSAQHYIHELCFHKEGPLVEEFELLFASLFKRFKLYIGLIRLLAKHRCGLSQEEIIQKKHLSSGGRAIERLEDLEEAGFISKFIPHGKERGAYYKISDEYTLFYLDWIEPRLSTIRKTALESGFWLSQTRSAGWKSWAGLAFEAVCHKHASQIRKALSIDPGATSGSWRYVPRLKGKENGAQIDLLFDQPSGIITVCEIKYSNHPFILTQEYAKELARKIAVYKQQTRATKEIFLAMVTSSGVKASKLAQATVSQEVGLDDLFVK